MLERKAVVVKAGQPRFLERNIVVIRQIIDADNRAALFEQHLGYVISDKPGRAGN
jgi:hypothetical protein